MRWHGRRALLDVGLLSAHFPPRHNKTRAAKTGGQMARTHPKTPKPFAPFEWMIAWRYLRARRAEGGVSVMTWISLIGITLAVFALIATLAVRSGFRHEFVGTILGANAHITVYTTLGVDENGQTTRALIDYEDRAARLAELPFVTRAAPLVRGQVMTSLRSRNAGVEVYGIAEADLLSLPGIVNPEQEFGSLARFSEGVSIGSGVAQQLNAAVGDRIKLISPDGVRTAFGTSPRVKSYEIVHIFSVGRYDIDRTRIYMPFEEAQSYFNRGGAADEIEVMVTDPEAVDELFLDILRASGDDTLIWTWRDASGSFLRALDIEDNVMFIILSILVLIAAMNIVSGLIMLVKNKGRDVGILRTIGLSEGSILRIFFICGAFTGIIGTGLGVILGCLFALYIDPIFSFVNYVAGGGVWDPSIRGIYELPARLEFDDVMSAVSLSLGLSFIVTIFPARRAARMNPVEALRYE
ncbi:MAG: lipoprotein-releasing system permease protein [Polaromonas sp.]|jgi:lipoprotein-releasing system permease protein